MRDDRVTVRDAWLVPILERLLSAHALDALLDDPGQRLWESAVARRLATDQALLHEASAQLGLAAWDGSPVPEHLRDLVPEQWLRKFNVLPVAVTGTSLTIATASPDDLDCERTLAFATGRAVVMVLASPAAIASGLDALFAADPERGGFAVTRPNGSETTQLAEGPVVALVDALIAAGIAARASDIHLEQEEAGIVVRHRVDGVLRQAALIEPERGLPLVSRIKIMAGLDIADRLRPQDGRMTVMLGAGEVDLRVSTLPAARGEKVVLRVLDARAGAASLDTLGLSIPASLRLRNVLDAREGLVLVTGPTGSGKTTTLYAALRSIMERGVNVVTVEDPVEYRIPGVAQVQVSTRTGLSFASALRSILRQDPDVILVGEIRDAETASIAIQAALTGHLVLSTLHTLDAASAVTRLDDLGVDRYKVAASLRGVVAQRLLRRLCDACRVAETHVEGAALERWIAAGTTTWVDGGCEACGGTGFRGRIAVTETLIVDAAVERAIAAGASADVIADLASEGGMERLWSAGIAQILAGRTSVGELQRVVDTPFPPAVQSLVRDARAKLGGRAPRVAEPSGGPSSDHDARMHRALASLEQFDLTEPVARAR